MYAIVEIAGQQFKVEKDQEIFVHRLAGEEGSSVEFDNVMLLENNNKVSVGTPVLNGTSVKAKILEHMKADKVSVFHKKRRKGYQKENGHRQYMSKILIEDIVAGAKKKAKAEPEATPKAEAKTATPKTEVKAPKAEAPKAKAKPKAETKKAPVAKAKAAPKEKASKAEAKKETKPKAAKKEEPKKDKE